MCIAIVLFKNKTITKIITIGYALMHIWFTIYCWMNLNKTELGYFTYNSPGRFIALRFIFFDNSYYLPWIYLCLRG